MKKLCTLLFAILVGTCSLFAYDVKIGDLYYNLNVENKTAQVTNTSTQKNGRNYINLNNTIIDAEIPSSIEYNNELYTVTSIGSYAFCNCPYLHSVTIPNTITFIESYAFKNCNYLNSVTFSNTITSLGGHIFENCIDLASIEIPNSVSTIGSYAFSGCSKLTSVTFGSSVTRIGERTFSGCTDLKSITWNAKNCEDFSDYTTPFYSYYGDQYDIRKQITSFVFGEEVEHIPNHLCENMTNLSSISIPSNVTRIGDYAFSGCTSIESVSIPNSVRIIGSGAFYGWKKLSSIEIPIDVDSIGEYAFRGCTSLTSIAWNAQKCEYSFNYSPFKDSHEQISSFTFGEKVESIPSYLCQDMDKLESISIPNTVKSIGKNVFSGCSSLTAFSIPDNVTIIENSTFNGCSNLTTITIPNNIKEIGDYAYYNCAGLRTVNLSNQVQHIGAHAFENCTRLNNLNLPNTLTSVGTNAFKNTPFFASAGEWENGIKYISTCIVGSNPNEISNEPILRKNTTAICNGAFKNCKNMISITLPDVITAIPDSAFYYCYNLTFIKIPNKVTSIGDCAFRHCTDLTSVEIPNSVTSIGQYVFNDCSSLTSVTIGNSVTNIGDGAFYGCSSLTSVTIPNSVANIGIRTFGFCSSIKSIIWNAKRCANFQQETTPFYFNGFYNMSNRDFYDIRANITSFVFGDEVEEIPAWLCSGMKNLTSVTIPNSVKSIGNSAFSGCTGVKQITIGHAIESIGDNAFDKCPNVMTIYSYLETPPVINNTVFAGFGTYKGVDLYVPEGAKANYEAMDYWKDFYIIEGLPDIIDNKLHYTLNEETQTATLITSSLAELKPVIDGELIIPDTVVSNGKTYVVTAIGNNVFKDNSTITTVVIPSSVTQIGDSAFYGSSITSVVIGGTEVPAPNIAAARRIITESICCSIGAYAFANCKKLTEINFPECVSAIGEGTFKDCSALTTINSKMQNPPVIDETVFEGCGDLGNITLMVPEGSEETYKNMAVWKEFLLNASLKTYTITFVNWDGAELLKLADVQEGTLPVYTAELPTRPEDDEFTYSFIGWTPEIVPVIDDATYTATYEATPKAEGVEDVIIDGVVTQKLLRDGQILILRGGKTYTVTGQEIK